MKGSFGKKSDELWEQIEYNQGLVLNSLALSTRDLKTARRVFSDKDYDWAFSISYNAMLQAARALMFEKGYRPIGANRHISVVEFLKRFYKEDLSARIIFVFNKIRKKRHMAVYEQIRIISRNEAAKAIETGSAFISSVKKLIIKNTK